MRSIGRIQQTFAEMGSDSWLFLTNVAVLRDQDFATQTLPQALDEIPYSITDILLSRCRLMAVEDNQYGIFQSLLNTSVDLTDRILPTTENIAECVVQAG